LHTVQYRDNNNTKGNGEKTEKTGKPGSPQEPGFPYRSQREMKKTDTQIQTPKE
jgi:hypothetical protein